MAPSYASTSTTAPAAVPVPADATGYDQNTQPYAPNQTTPPDQATYSYSSGDACQYPQTLPAYADRRYVRTVHVNTVAEPEYQYPEYQYQGDANRYEGRVHHRRSTGKSVAIVAGSAGVGAAIGAIAGGGKGAGIGAIAGGAGGFVYDRLTHNH